MPLTAVRGAGRRGDRLGASTTDGERLIEFRDKIEDDRTTNATRFTTLQDATSARRSTSSSWYVERRRRRCSGSRSSPSIVAAVVLLWIGIDGWRRGAPRWSDVVLVALGVLRDRQRGLLLIVAHARVRLWRRRTKPGQTEAERWDAFRRYLTDFPRLQEAPPATLELWERFLVYGIAFGIAERVLQGAQLHMPEELHDQSSIYWITPYGDLGSGADRARRSATSRPASARRWRRRPRPAGAAASRAAAVEAAAVAAAARGSPTGSVMAKLIYSAIASLDGYVEDEDGNFDWAAPDEEVHAFVNDLERPIGTYLYGRRMYEMMVVLGDRAHLADEPPRHAGLRGDLAGGRQDRLLHDAARRCPAPGRGSSATSTPTRSGS